MASFIDQAKRERRRLEMEKMALALLGTSDPVSQELGRRLLECIVCNTEPETGGKRCCSTDDPSQPGCNLQDQPPPSPNSP